MEGESRCLLGSQAQHTHTMFGLFYSTPPHTHTQYFHNILQQNNNLAQNIVNYYTKQFQNTVRHSTYKTTRSIQKIQGYNITLTTTQ